MRIIMTTYRVILADRVVDTIVYVSEKSEECVRKDVIKFDAYPDSVKVRKEVTCDIPRGKSRGFSFH